MLRITNYTISLYEDKQTPATRFLIKLSSANYSINQSTLCEMTWRKLGWEKAKLS